MINLEPLENAQLCAEIYNTDVGFSIYNNGEVYVGYRALDGIDMFVFRGSKTIDDWIDDFVFVPSYDPQLGIVDTGMFEGIHDAYTWCASRVRLGCKSSFTGHSLGGAHARLMCGLFCLNNLPTGWIMVFGSPRPSGKQLKDIIVKSGIKHTSYRHRNDIVPTLPPDIFGYVHTENYITLINDPSPGISALGNHNIQLYIEALQD